MAAVPIVDYLDLAPTPHLVSQQCVECAALYFDRRNACARCGTTSFAVRPLENAGRVIAFTSVHRTANATGSPFFVGLVKLEGGGIVKANLLGVADPHAVDVKRPVHLETFVAGVDDDGTEAVAFGYTYGGSDE